MASRFNYSRFLAQAALIAAVYTVPTAFAPLSYGESMIQVEYRCLQFCLTTLRLPFGLFIG